MLSPAHCFLHQTDLDPLFREAGGSNLQAGLRPTTRTTKDEGGEPGKHLPYLYIRPEARAPALFGPMVPVSGL